MNLLSIDEIIYVINQFELCSFSENRFIDNDLRDLGMYLDKPEVSIPLKSLSEDHDFLIKSNVTSHALNQIRYALLIKSSICIYSNTCILK